MNDEKDAWEMDKDIRFIQSLDEKTRKELNLDINPNDQMTKDDTVSSNTILAKVLKKFHHN